MKKLLLAATTCGLLVPGSAFAGCTQEEMMRKLADLQTAMTAYAQKHPDKAAEMSAKARNMTTKGTPNLDDVCKAYDEMIATLK